MIALPVIKIDNSQILGFVKSPKMTNLRKSKYAKITRSKVLAIRFNIEPTNKTLG